MNTVFVRAEQDTVKADSSAYSVQPLLTHGRVTINNFRDDLINKKDILWQNYFNLSDILKNRLPVYPLASGQYGEVEHLSVFGSNLNDNSISFNGIGLSVPYIKNYNINNFSPDFFQNIEVFTGSDAVIFGSNSSGFLLNMQQIIYNTRKPYTKILYNQAGGNYLSLDAVYSQNLSENINLFMGIRSQSAKNQSDNNNFDFWNVRAGLRWNPDTNTSISVIDNFTNHKLGRNGGINRNLSDNIFDNVTALPKYTSLSEREYLHNLNITASRLIGGNHQISANLFFSHSLNENSLDTAIIKSPGKSLTYKYTYWQAGATAGVSSKNEYLSYDFGGEIKYFDNYASLFYPEKILMTTAGYGRIVLSLFDNMYLSGGGRFTYYDKKLYNNLGASLFIKNFLNSRIDLSYSENLPRHELFGKSDKESNLLAFYTLNQKIGNLSIYGGAFYRIRNGVQDFVAVQDPNYEKLLISNDKHKIYGAVLDLNYEIFKDFNCKVWGLSQFIAVNDVDKKYLPSLYSGLDINYRRVVGRSEFLVGVSSSFKLSHNSYAYSPVPVINGFYMQDEVNNFSYDGLSAYFITRLGNAAYVKVSGENLLNSDYYYISYYTMPKRNIRISVFWEFFD